MENTEIPPEKPEETAQTDRVAHCLACSNEWKPRDITGKKPIRCPECKSRRVKWRENCTPAELAEGKIDGKKAVIPEEEPDTEPEEPPVKVELPPEEPEKTGGNEEPLKEQIIFKGSDVKLPPEKPRTEKTDAEIKAEIEKDMKGRITGLPLIFLLGGICLIGLMLMFFRGRTGRGKISMAQAQAFQAEQERQRRAAAEQTLRLRLNGGIF